jgi:hypothetical protein
LELLTFYSDAKPNHIGLSQSFAFWPPDVIAASFGLDPALFASLAKQGDVVIAPAPPGFDELRTASTPTAATPAP